MKHYLVRRPDGEYYSVSMYDPGDAALNEHLGKPVSAHRLNFGTKSDPEVFEVIDLSIG